MHFSVTGLLEEILLTDVARFIQAARQTGLLGITSNGVRGAIYFDKGQIVDAESHESSGLAALDQLAVFTEGSFKWYDAVRSPHQRLKDHPNSELIRILEVKILEARLIMDVPERCEGPSDLDRATIPAGFKFGPKPRSTIAQVARLLDGLFKPPPKTKTASGSLAQKSLAHFTAQELVQIFCLNGRCIRLLFITPGGQRGEIAIWRGRVHHAEFAGESGDEAFYSMARLKQSQLPVQEMQELREEPPISVTTTWEHLLMEAAFRRDLENKQAK